MNEILTTYFKEHEGIEHIKGKLFSIRALSHPIDTKLKSGNAYSEYMEYRTGVKLKPEFTGLILPTPNGYLKHLLLSPFTVIDNKTIKIPFKYCPEGFRNREEDYNENNVLYKQGDIIAYIMIID
jgi:hypothetical protein